MWTAVTCACGRNAECAIPFHHFRTFSLSFTHTHTLMHARNSHTAQSHTYRLHRHKWSVHIYWFPPSSSPLEPRPWVMSPFSPLVSGGSFVSPHLQTCHTSPALLPFLLLLLLLLHLLLLPSVGEYRLDGSAGRIIVLCYLGICVALSDFCLSCVELISDLYPSLSNGYTCLLSLDNPLSQSWFVIIYLMMMNWWFANSYFICCILAYASGPAPVQTGIQEPCSVLGQSHHLSNIGPV